MSAQANAANAANTVAANAAGAGDSETQDDAAKAASEVNARLLQESRDNKKKAQDYKARLDELEKSKLTEKEEYKKLFEASETKYKTLHTTLVSQSVKAAVSEKASKAGAIDLDAIMALGDRQLLAVDAETLAVDGVDTYIDDLKKKKPHLFATGKPAAVNGVSPGGVTKSGTKSIKEMTKEELIASLKALG